jgi:MFS family permease
MNIASPQKLGLVFCGWGVFVAAFAVWGAPWLKARFGTARTLYGNFFLMSLDLIAIGIWPDHSGVVIVAVIVAGIFCGVNNTLVTTAVMSIAPVERPVASATYGFVRFIGGGLAPFCAGKLVEHYNAHVPFLLAGAAVLAAAVVLSTVHRALAAADRGEVHQVERTELDRVEREDELQVGAGIGNES